MLCDQMISIAIYDRVKDKMVMYNSSEEFTFETAVEMMKKEQNDKYEEFTNEDYNSFAFNQTVSNQAPSNLLFS